MELTLNRATPVLITLVAALTACDPLSEAVILPEFEFAFSFENGLGDWTPAALGVNAPGTWSATSSDAQASEGSRSVRIALDEPDGAAQVWIRAPLEVTPEQTYDVQLTFDLGTSDQEGVTPWIVLAGAHGVEPLTNADLAARDGTTSDPSAGSDPAFVEKRYTLTAKADEDGMLWISIGVRAASADARVYWIDHVRLLLTRV